MSIVEKNTLKIYTDNMLLKIAEIEDDLKDLTQILTNRSLTRHEYHSAERLLQVLIESCIGLSKHWIKLLEKTVPTDAYQAIKLLKGHGYISDEEALNWKKIIGLRNALVHDYLNIESEIIKKIINDQFYTALIDFAKKAANSICVLVK